jgi:hypothetical protein
MYPTPLRVSEKFCSSPCGLVVTPAPVPLHPRKNHKFKSPLLAGEWQRQLAFATDGTLIA